MGDFLGGLIKGKTYLKAFLIKRQKTAIELINIVELSFLLGRATLLTRMNSEHCDLVVLFLILSPEI